MLVHAYIIITSRSGRSYLGLFFHFIFFPEEGSQRRGCLKRWRDFEAGGTRSS